jgi:hypothetical protein
MTPTELVLSKLPDARPNGQGWQCRCPAHEDQNSSLSIAEGDDGRALLKCHAGCATKDVVAALGIRMADLMPAANPNQHSQQPTGRRIVKTYDYRDEHSGLLFQVVRMEPKTFRQRVPQPGGGWSWSVKDVRRLLYRLPELVAADPAKVVFIPEGEKDVDRLISLGFLATCNPGGAGKWKSEYCEFLRGRPVVVLADNDEVGQKHAQAVARSLTGIAKVVKIVNLSGLPPKGDVSDWLNAGGTRDQLVELVKAAPVFQPPTNRAAVPKLKEWGTIEPLGVANVPPFPVAVLPTMLAEFVTAEAEATQTPADLAAMLCLAVCAAAVAKKVEVRVRDDWIEPVNLFTVTVLEPGNRKSAVFSHATAPLREFEAQLIEQERPEIARQLARRRQRERQMKVLEEKAAKKGDTEAGQKAEEIAVELATMPEPVLPRLIVDDATSEKLGAMLAEQGGQIASMSPEGGVFDLMAGLYTKSGMPQFGVYLMGHAGDDLRVDRISRKGEHVQRPALTMGLAIQPMVLEGLLENSAFRGRGLLARFLYSLPESHIGARKIEPEPVPESVRQAYHNLVWRLCELPWDASQPQYLQLADDAWVLLRKFMEKLEPELGAGGELDCAQDWGSKLAGAVTRIAGVMHCVIHAYGEPWLHPLAATTIAAAIEIGQYATIHALAAFEAMRTDKGLSDAQYILRWIERHGKTEFAKSEAQQHGKRRFKQASDIDTPLALLVRHNYIRLRSAAKRGPGRPASPVYEVNPALRPNAPVGERPENPANADSERDASNLQNIQSALGDVLSGNGDTNNGRVRIEI